MSVKFKVGQPIYVAIRDGIIVDCGSFDYVRGCPYVGATIMLLGYACSDIELIVRGDNIVEREVESANEFKVGRRVKWQGVEGRVLLEENERIEVQFGPGMRKSFHKDGRPYEDVPRLELIARPKVKKIIERWENIYCDRITSVFYSKEQADKGAGPSRIACVKLTGEYEVEE
jgi:hypothetical protein